MFQTTKISSLGLQILNHGSKASYLVLPVIHDPDREGSVH